MALIGFEGFDLAAASSGLLGLPCQPFSTGLGMINGGIWNTNGSNYVRGAGLLGGAAIFLSVSNISLTLDTNYQTIIVGCRIQPNTATIDFLKFFDGGQGGTVQCGLSVSNNKLIVWRGTTATVLATGTSTLVPTSWYYIEISITISNVAGAFEVHLNGVAEPNLTVSGVNTRTSANNQLNGLFVGNTSSNAGYDDMYIVDTTGPSPRNTFLGIIRCETLFPTSNNSVTWTPLTSTNVSQVQEQVTDGDTTYCFSPSSGQIDTFNHGSLTSTPATIFAVDVMANMRKDDVTVQNGRTKLISGGTTSTGVSQVLSTVYQNCRDSYLLDPNTAAAWTGANVNATKIGYEHV